MPDYTICPYSGRIVRKEYAFMVASSFAPCGMLAEVEYAMCLTNDISITPEITRWAKEFRVMRRREERKP